MYLPTLTFLTYFGFLGPQISVVTGTLLSSCGCKKFQLDTLGDHLSTCTTHWHTKSKHNRWIWSGVSNVVTSSWLTTLWMRTLVSLVLTLISEGKSFFKKTFSCVCECVCVWVCVRDTVTHNLFSCVCVCECVCVIHTIKLLLLKNLYSEIQDSWYSVRRW
jgi:hypothetical protein